MDVVKAFNSELSSLYEVKPPISKAKMTSITKSAIKGIKFYKHIVQSVEKFIQKCRPEYKVPGLYVVDSIVRQSRHQFGADKDVFGPRFIKNITTTFQHLFKCVDEDRSRIIRVLNLWQKNNVFPIDIIQPLLDMGHPNTSNESAPTNDESRTSRHKEIDSSWKGWPQANDEPPPENRTYAEMSTKNLEKFTKAEMTSAIEDEVSRSSMFRAQIKQENMQEENTVKFNKKLLDFDYGDEEDEEEAKNDESHLSNQPNALALSMAQNLLCNPELLHKLQQMQHTIQQNALNSDLNLQGQHTIKQEPEEVPFSSEMPNSPAQPMLPPMPFTEASTMMQYQAGIPYPPQQPPLPMGLEPMSMDSVYAPALPPEQQQHLMQHAADEDERLMYSMPGEPPLPPQDFDERAMVPVEERSRKERSRSRSGSRTRRSGRHRSRSRSPRRKRSRSRSPRSKNRSRSKERERIREKERERERERERKKKGIPPIKKGYVSVCSTTLWMGHVPKSCTEVEISNAFGPYGSILSIDMIPPRGCAYVVMDRRQDAYKALQKLKNTKLLQSNSVKMAWAPGKGVKGKEYKDYWEVDAGVSYVPYEKIPTDPEALDLLEEGGFIDEESLPEHLKALRQQPDEKSTFGMHKMVPDTTTYNAMQAPPMVPPPIIPPTSVNVPMLLHPMQPQFGLHLPGLLPPQAMVMQVPMGIPPPSPMLMVQQQSQNMLGSQALPLVGGVPPLVQRTLPNIANALQNISKNTVAEPAISSTTGDATPTDEDGTSVSSPGTAQKSVPSSVASTTVNSTQSGIPVTQFNPMLNLPNANRQILSVPPPVSASGTPIPYPPPHNVGFNFPPPGMRPPGMAPNSQFSWMQKPPGSPFTESDSSQSRQAPGMPPHMFNNRPPFHEMPSSLPQNTPVKDGHNSSRDNVERRPGDMEPSGNRNPSPIHPDKMPQEMVISTDDESSMDRDYPHNEMAPAPRFPGMTEFPRMPMNMHRMRNPMGPMPGARFPPGMRMGSPFPPRMGGPRGMHPGHRMEMDFPPGPRGPRMSGMPPGPRRMDGPHHQNEGRDWYPRDFEGPPFEREMHFYDDRNRDSWTTPESLEGDMRHPPRNQERMRDMEKRDGYNHHGPDKQMMDDDFNMRQRQRPQRKSKPNDDSYEDMCRLNFYQRDKKSTHQYHPNKQSDQRRKDEIPNKSPYKNDSNRNTDQPSAEVNVQANNVRIPAEKMDQESSMARRDREARKRSRWGRTLSEEREFQQQKRNEIEMKFQSYEQSAQAAQLLLPNSVEASSSEKAEDAESDAKPPSNCDMPDNPVPELASISSDSQNFASETSDSQQISDQVSAIPATEVGNLVLETGVTEPVFEPDTVQSASEPHAVPSVSEPPVSNPFSEPIVTKLSESSDVNPISEPRSTELSSEPLAADLLPDPTVSEPADSVRFSEPISKMTCGSNFIESVSNPNGMDTESEIAQGNETINPNVTNSSSPCNNDNNKSEISSTKTSPLLSTES